MSGLKEFFFIISVLSLHVAGFLQPSSGGLLLAGDNILLTAGLIIALTSKNLSIIKLSNKSKTIFYFGVVLIFLIPFYIYLKGHDYIESVPTEIISFAKMFIRLYLVFSFVKYLNLGFAEYSRGLKSILFMGVIISFSMIYQPIFENFGFNVYQIGTLYNPDDPFRFAGITAMSVNVVGLMFTMLLGVALDLHQKQIIDSKLLLFYSSFFLIGVLLTGSRTGLIITVVVYLMYLYKNYFKMNTKSKFINYTFIIIAIFLFLNFAGTTLYRVERYSNVEYGGLGYRIGYWGLYLLDIANNPEYLIYGNTAPATYHRSPHNFYIYTVFNAGLLFLFLPFYYLKKFFSTNLKNIKKDKKNLSLDPSYIIIPQLLFWFTANEPITWFGLILLMATGIEYKQSIE